MCCEDIHGSITRQAAYSVRLRYYTHYTRTRDSCTSDPENAPFCGSPLDGPVLVAPGGWCSGDGGEWECGNQPRSRRRAPDTAAQPKRGHRYKASSRLAVCARLCPHAGVPTQEMYQVVEGRDISTQPQGESVTIAHRAARPDLEREATGLGNRRVASIWRELHIH